MIAEIDGAMGPQFPTAIHAEIARLALEGRNAASIAFALVRSGKVRKNDFDAVERLAASHLKRQLFALPA